MRAGTTATAAWSARRKILRRDGHASVASVRAQLGIDSDEIREAFQGLVDDGVLKWAGKDEVELARQPKWPRDEWYRRILDVLDSERPMGIREIATALGRKPENTRNYVTALVAKGDVIATAPQSSTKRKYLLAH